MAVVTVLPGLNSGSSLVPLMDPGAGNQGNLGASTITYWSSHSKLGMEIGRRELLA